jgi:hypothetical protein
MQEQNLNSNMTFEYLWNPQSPSALWAFSSENQNQIDALLESTRCKFEVQVHHGKRSSGYVLKDCVITNVIDPYYSTLENLIRYIGRIFRIESLSTFHQQQTSFEFSVGSVELFEEYEEYPK